MLSEDAMEAQRENVRAQRNAIMIHNEKETHWCYPDLYSHGVQIVYRNYREAACGQIVDYRYDCDLQAPTCEECKKEMKEYNEMESLDV